MKGMGTMRNDYQQQNQMQQMNGYLMGRAGGEIANRYGCFGGCLVIVLCLVVAVIIWAFLLKPAVNVISSHYDYRTGWQAEPKQERVVDDTPDHVQEVTPTYEDEQYNYDMQDAQEDAYNSLNEDVYNQ